MHVRTGSVPAVMTCAQRMCGWFACGYPCSSNCAYSTCVRTFSAHGPSIGSSFSGGKATIVVQADGSFTWTRQIRKDKAVTGYVTWTDVESNKVTWLKVR